MFGRAASFVAVGLQISEPGQLARITAVTDAGTRLWLELATGGTATVDSDEPFTAEPGGVVLLRPPTNHMEFAPAEAWPEERNNGPSGGMFVGVVKLRDDSVTIIDAGGRWSRVPTNEVEYHVGNTVEVTEAAGVKRVLADKPLRLIEPPAVDGDLIDAFLRKPTGELSFDDFGGLPDVVSRAKELIELPIERADKLRIIGAPAIKGVLFTGPPGTGKTMLARIIADTAGATFYAISGPTVFSKWYGESEEILRRIFDHAAENAPSIIFFDEIDSVAGQRTEDAHEASKRVVAQLLTLMDGLASDDRLTVIAATNRPQDIDVALRRPGRFDWQIDFPLPGRTDREAILRVHARGLSTVDPLPHAWTAANTEGWSPAELAAIWKEAALLAAAEDREAIMIEDYLGGHERVAAQRRQVAMEPQPVPV